MSRKHVPDKLDKQFFTGIKIHNGGNPPRPTFDVWVRGNAVHFNLPYMAVAEQVLLSELQRLHPPEPPESVLAPGTEED